MPDLVHAEPVPVIEMRGVTVSPARAPEATLISGVQWTIQPADYWLVGGLPGSGKSELLSVAAGVQRPSHGQVFAFGKDTAKLSELDLLQQRLGIGLVFGSGGRLFNHLTARQNVELPVCYHRNCSVLEAQEPVEAVLELTELTPFADYLPRQLTQSFRQRAALARALILRPRVLLLENLLVGMELRQVNWWLDFLARLHAGDAFLDRMPLTLVVAAQNVDPWRAHAKQFAVVRDQQFAALPSFDEFGLGDEPLLRAVSE